MPVTFDLGNGTSCHVQSDTHPVDTQRGSLPANEVVQGDYIRNISGEPRVEVVATPVVS